MRAVPAIWKEERKNWSEKKNETNLGALEDEIYFEKR